MTMEKTPRILDPALPRLTLGEGTCWDDEGQTLFFVDIEQGQLHSWHPRSRRHEAIDCGQKIGFAVPSADGQMICGLRDGLYRIDPASGMRQRLAALDDGGGAIRFNDGKCDPEGRLWAGTMSLEGDGMAPVATLYRYETALVAVEEEIELSNGMGWSPDGRVFYHVETGRKTVWRYDYDKATGRADARRALHVFTGNGAPDGMCVDAEGRIYVALFGEGRIAVLTPDGKETDSIVLPVSQVTNCAFGGASLKTLFITTASDGMDAAALRNEPLAGQVFELEMEVAGLPARRFRT
jgi:xylono-1,5-lactonase